ncbi:MAG: translation initiation factor IF-3 [Clostridia bacterium]|nr:translation initiation factor IF-3 [Clostridia bacterium]NLF21240.1 translation initiation factor IF-3 [Clostridiaceae bacterium]
MNEEIRFPQIRLINEEGNMVGVVSRDQALSMAESAGMDLVLISANPDNPVCRIMDYGKFQYEQAKRDKEARKSQKIIEVKEVGLKLTTDVHDFDVKVRSALRFLEDGDRVKVNIRFRGREMTHTNQGYDVMQRFAEACGEFGELDKAPRMEGRNMVMYLMPRKDKK